MTYAFQGETQCYMIMDEEISLEQFLRISSVITRSVNMKRITTQIQRRKHEDRQAFRLRRQAHFLRHSVMTDATDLNDRELVEAARLAILPTCPGEEAIYEIRKLEAAVDDAVRHKLAIKLIAAIEYKPQEVRERVRV